MSFWASRCIRRDLEIHIISKTLVFSWAFKRAVGLLHTLLESFKCVVTLHFIAFVSVLDEKNKRDSSCVHISVHNFVCIFVPLKWLVAECVISCCDFQCLD